MGTRHGEKELAALFVNRKKIKGQKQGLPLREETIAIGHADAAQWHYIAAAFKVRERKQLLKVSAATIDRLLSSIRKQLDPVELLLQILLDQTLSAA